MSDQDSGFASENSTKTIDHSPSGTSVAHSKGTQKVLKDHECHHPQTKKKQKFDTLLIDDESIKSLLDANDLGNIFGSE